MSGYDWSAGMSNRAVRAYEDGLLPASKIGHGIPAALVKRFVTPSEWHHASKFFNRVDFFDVAEVLAVFGMLMHPDFDPKPVAVAELAAWNTPGAAAARRAEAQARRETKARIAAREAAQKAEAEARWAAAQAKAKAEAKAQRDEAKAAREAALAADRAARGETKAAQKRRLAAEAKAAAAAVQAEVAAERERRRAQEADALAEATASVAALVAEIQAIPGWDAKIGTRRLVAGALAQPQANGIRRALRRWLKDARR